jgi:phage shock protein PspC (stress-responsive transcriptional regulator)
MRHKSVAGVCAGFAEYLDVDVTLMRIVWLCTGIFTGIGFIAYLVCWFVMPPDFAPAPAAAPAAKTVETDETPEAHGPSAQT